MKNENLKLLPSPRWSISKVINTLHTNVIHSCTKAHKVIGIIRRTSSDYYCALIIRRFKNQFQIRFFNLKFC